MSDQKKKGRECVSGRESECGHSQGTHSLVFCLNAFELRITCTCFNQLPKLVRANLNGIGQYNKKNALPTNHWPIDRFVCTSWTRYLHIPLVLNEIRFFIEYWQNNRRMGCLCFSIVLHLQFIHVPVWWRSSYGLLGYCLSLHSHIHSFELLSCCYLLVWVVSAGEPVLSISPHFYVCINKRYFSVSFSRLDCDLFLIPRCTNKIEYIFWTLLLGNHPNCVWVWVLVYFLSSFSFFHSLSLENSIE